MLAPPRGVGIGGFVENFEKGDCVCIKRGVRINKKFGRKEINKFYKACTRVHKKIHDKKY